MLIFTIVGSFWLEIVYKVGVLRRLRRLLFSIIPSAILFIAWDLYAIHRGHWHFDSTQILGLYLPGKLPLEEFLFFVIIPIAAIMTIEAVRNVKKDWKVEE
jgi:lycopene cyclase domain-containing protein